MAYYQNPITLNVYHLTLTEGQKVLAYGWRRVVWYGGKWITRGLK